MRILPISNQTQNQNNKKQNISFESYNIKSQDVVKEVGEHQIIHSLYN